MNNIQKSFKKKSELRCMADGGKPPYPATEYDFATSHGGGIKGPGGPTDDKVGPVMLSNKEYVLPADTVEAIGKDKLDALRDATHKFVDSEPGGLANGTPSTFYVDPDGVATRGAQPGHALVPMRQPGASTAMVPARTPGTAMTVPESLRAPAQATPAFRPQIMGAEGRASARASAFSAAGNPYGASRVAPAAANPAAAGAASVTPSTGALGKTAGAFGGALRGLGTAAVAAAPILMRNAATGEQQELAGGGRTGDSAYDAAGNAAGQSGAYLGSAASFGGLSPRDIGGITSSLRQTVGGNMSGPENMAAWDAVPQDERGWARRGIESLQRGLGLAPALPDFSNVKGGVQTKQGSLRPVEGGVAGTGSPMANEKPPTGPQYYADLERQHQQELAQMRGGNREAGARAAAGGGPGAGQYPGLVENRSGLANSALTGADPNSYYASLKDDAIAGSFNGRNYTKKELDARGAGLATASGQAMKPEGDPAMAEIRSALRGIGGGGGGNWAPRSQADEINARYDSLMRGGSGRNIVKGSDWSQRHGLDVEMARAKELGADASNQSALRGQNMSANAAADQTRMSGVTKMMELQAEREKNAATGNAAATKAQQAALKQAADANQQGYENFTKATDSMFIGPEGKPDTAMREQFMDFVSATDPKFLEENVGVSSIKDLFSLGPQEQMAATQKLKTMMQMQQAANASRSKGMFNSGMESTGFEAPVGDPREYSLRDVASGNLSPSRYAYNFVNPFADDRVQELEGGSVVPYDDYVGKSADREKARKSNLRNP